MFYPVGRRNRGPRAGEPETPDERRPPPRFCAPLAGHPRQANAVRLAGQFRYRGRRTATMKREHRLIAEIQAEQGDNCLSWSFQAIKIYDTSAKLA